MRVVSYYPGAYWPRIEQIELKSPVGVTVIEVLGIKVLAIYDPLATEPNRLIDGRVVNGRLSLCHYNFRSFSLEFAQRVRDEVEFDQAQFMAVEGGFCCV